MSTRLKSENTSCRRCSGMPTPLSLTEIRQPCSARREAIRTTGGMPGRANFTELVTRFSSTEYMSSGSACTTGSSPVSIVAPAGSSMAAMSARSCSTTLAQVDLPRASGCPGPPPNSMCWSSIRDSRSAARAVRVSSAPTAGSGWSLQLVREHLDPGDDRAQGDPHVMAELGSQLGDHGGSGLAHLRRGRGGPFAEQSQLDQLGDAERERLEGSLLQGGQRLRLGVDDAQPTDHLPGGRVERRRGIEAGIGQGSVDEADGGEPAGRSWRPRPRRPRPCSSWRGRTCRPRGRPRARCRG